MTGQQLKNSILQMAVQGKLVPQDPNDEPASVLIERIREEKEQLIKDGKIKKEKNPSRIFRGADNLPYEQIGKNQPVCIADEVPFDIPDSWEWVRLDDIGIYRKGPFGSALTKGMFVNKGPDTIKVYEQKNAIKKNHLLGDYYITRKYFEEKMQSFSVKPGDIIVSCAGTIGETYVLPNNIEAGIINQALMRMEIFAPINIDYFLLYFDYVLKDFARMNSKGSAIKNIPPFAIFKKLLLPLPPLAEQIRICKKLKEVITYIETYSVKEQNLSVLNNTFPEQLKKSILQEAVMGKLVPQDENDEPASVLLERIREEKQRLIAEGKIKKDKNESTIFRRDNSHYEKLNGIERCIDDEIPFDIPDNWCWTRLGEVFQHNTGKALNSSNKDGIPLTYITTSNLYWNRFELDELKEMLFTDNEIEKCTVQKGDLLVCEGGDIGRTAIWNYDYPIRIQNHIHRLRSYATVSIEYFYHLLFLYKNLGLIAGKGIGIKGLSSKSLHNILVPLPPLNEQYRIVEQLNTVLPQCEKL